MRPVRRRLLQEGWSAVHLPTARYEVRDIDHLGAWAARHIKQASTIAGGAPVDVVTHSMGGLVLRSSLRHDPPLRRVVMLSPPNAGALRARQMRALIPVHRIGWDPLAPLLPGAPDRLPNAEGPIEVGVLTGARHDAAHRGYFPWLGADNDGKVRIDEAPLTGANDFRVVKAHHTFIMAQRDVLDLVVRFMRTGNFGGADAPGS
jgi:alpha-beta hydrolase superfamily lysophospholipase